MLGSIFGTKKRKPFPVSVRKIEWMIAAGRDPNEYIVNKKFYKTSYCRKCKTRFIWLDGKYEFDHKDNNNSNIRQNNCYLVCRNCHGKVTKTKVIKQRGIFGGVSSHKTIKLKVGYKKVTKKKTTTPKPKKKKPSDDFWL